jgi:hypothetical protein
MSPWKWTWQHRLRTTASLPVIDFHTHYFGQGFTPASTANLPAALRSHWDAINAKLVDENAPLADIHSGDLTGRVVNAPTALLADPTEAIAPHFIARINDRLAALTQRHPGKIFGLATIDAFSGDLGWNLSVSRTTQMGLREPGPARSKATFAVERTTV